MLGVHRCGRPAAAAGPPRRLLISRRPAAPRPRREIDRRGRPRPERSARREERLAEAAVAEQGRRPFQGLTDEPLWVLLREILPSATLPLPIEPGAVPGLDPDREVLLGTVLPTSWPGLVRADGRVVVAAQTPSRSGDASRDLAQVLLAAADWPLGSPITGLPIPAADAPRLQDLLTDAALEVSLHTGFEWWVEGVAGGEAVQNDLEQANAQATPTEEVPGFRAAYWAQVGERNFLRWSLAEDEEPLLDAFARLSVAGTLTLGEGTRLVGTFRACGRLVPVFELPDAVHGADLGQPLTALRAALDAALADPAPLTAEQRQARSEAIRGQVTLR